MLSEGIGPSTLSASISLSGLGFAQRKVSIEPDEFEEVGDFEDNVEPE